jgi:hypothetical protein
MRGRPPGPARTTEARREDLAFMAEMGECLTGAAKRLGITPGTLEDWCRKHDAREILALLLDHEPRDWHYMTARNGVPLTADGRVSA